MRRIFSGLRPFVPDAVASVLSNCGGTNGLARFAGNLERAGLTEAEMLAIYHSLIFPNGVRKSTRRGRNAQVLNTAVAHPSFPTDRRLRVLDVGASAGLDAAASLEILRARAPVDTYVLGDLNTHVLYDRARGLVFDQDHNLLQIRRRRSFVSVHFSYNYRFQRITNAPKHLRPWLLSRTRRFEPSADVVSLPLVHPDLRVDDPSSPFKLKRMNVFDPLDERFDVIICMHLLVPRYFDAATIERGVDNLTRALTPGGVLVVGAAESYRVVVNGSRGLEEQRCSA